jgi:hypothetical protein
MLVLKEEEKERVHIIPPGSGRTQTGTFLTNFFVHLDLWSCPLLLLHLFITLWLVHSGTLVLHG